MFVQSSGLLEGWVLFDLRPLSTMLLSLSVYSSLHSIFPSDPRDQSEWRVKGFSVSLWCTISHLILSGLFPLFSPYSTQVARALSNNWLFSFFIFVRRERIPEDSATGAAKSNGRVCFWTSANRERGCVRENKRQEKRNSLHDLIKQTQMVTAGWPWVQDTETDRMETTAWRD